MNLEVCRMKMFLIMLALLSVNAEDKVYLPLSKLTFKDGKVFLEKKECCPLLLPAIEHDDKGYYLAANSREGVSILRCGYCGAMTWWSERQCCLNDNCPYYCF